MMNPKKMPVSHWGYSCIFQHANLQRDTVPIFRQNVIDSEDEFFPYHEALKVGNADLTKIIIAVFPISKQSYDALKLKLALEFWTVDASRFIKRPHATREVWSGFKARFFHPGTKKTREGRKGGKSFHWLNL